MSRITIVDYSNGNVNSVLRALDSIGATARFSRERRDIEEADFLILPGVGHSGTAMASLLSNDLVAPLEAAVLERKVPVLGICLGMQLMLEHIEEGDCAGLGWISGRAPALSVRDRKKYKVPHIGWNSVRPGADSRLYAGQAQEEESFYFCHKYTAEGVAGVASTASFRYESERTASFERDNIFGVQFHPEKSHEAGQRLLRAFLACGR